MPRTADNYPSLLDELVLGTAEFNHKYRHSPLKRAKRRKYLCNVAVALGNLHHPEAARPLAQALMFDPEPLVRGHAAWALGQVSGGHAIGILESAGRAENDPMVRSEIELSLQELGKK
jgi:epoxyqueuosine reductase